MNRYIGLCIAGCGLLLLALSGAGDGGQAASLATDQASQPESINRPPPYRPAQSTTPATPCPAAWALVPPQNPDPSSNWLLAVAGTSPTDVWTVGSVPIYSALIEHWDGSTWHLSPVPPNSGNLAGLTILSPTDIWAVGSYFYQN